MKLEIEKNVRLSENQQAILDVFPDCPVMVNLAEAARKADIPHTSAHTAYNQLKEKYSLEWTLNIKEKKQ